MALIDEIRKTSKESRENYENLIQSFIDKIENYKKENPYSDGVYLGKNCGNKEAEILRNKGYSIGFDDTIGAWCYWRKKLTPKEEEEKRKYEEEQRIYWENRKIEEGEKEFNSIIGQIKNVALNPDNENHYVYKTLYSPMNEYCKKKFIEEGFKISIKTYEDGSDYCGWDTIYEYTIKW